MRKKSKSDIADILLVYAAFIPNVFLILQQILLGLNVMPHEQLRVVNISLSALFMAVAMVIVVRRNLIFAFASFTLVVLLIAITLLAFPKNTLFLKDGMFYLLLINVPTMLSIASVNKYDNIINSLMTISYVIFVLGVFYFLMVIGGTILFSTYNMSFTYYLLVPALMFLYKKRLVHTLMFVLILIMMVILGSRGALFIALAYLFVSNKFFIKSNVFVKISFVIALILLLSLNYSEVLLFLENRLNFTPRTLDLLTQGKIAVDSGRGEAFEMVWNNILNKPIFGYGLFGDRLLLEGLQDNMHAHNFFLELFHAFGLIVGGIIVLILFFFGIIQYRTTNRENKKLIIFFIFLGFIPLLFSGSVLTDTWFAWVLGSLFFVYKNNRILN